MQREFKALYFKEATNKAGGKIFIGKRQSDTHEGDDIIIANTGTQIFEGVTRKGRWDVECKEMHSGRGFVVLKARYSEDSLTLDMNTDVVLVLLNGEKAFLRPKEDKKRYIPLMFDPSKWFDPELISENIREKSTYLQLGSWFNLDIFIEEFKKTCEMMQESYNKMNG